MKVVYFLFVSIITYGCASLPEKAGLAYPPERLYQVKCASCHRLYAPKKYPYTKLKYYVEKYGGNLSNDEKNALMEYLFKAAKPE